MALMLQIRSSVRKPPYHEHRSGRISCRGCTWEQSNILDLRTPMSCDRYDIIPILYDPNYIPALFCHENSFKCLQFVVPQQFTMHTHPSATVRIYETRIHVFNSEFLEFDLCMNLQPNISPVELWRVSFKHVTTTDPVRGAVYISTKYYIGAPPMSGMHHAHGMMIPGSRMNGPNIPPPGAMNGPPMGNMGPHMMPSPGGPIHGPVPGSMSSPLGNMGPSPMPGSMSGNGPINGPMMSPMGPMNNGAPMGSMNGPINNSPMNGPGGPINGIPANMNNQMNGMGGMNNSMNAHNHCNMNHNAGGGNFMMPMNNMYQKPLPVSAGKVYPADQPMVFNSQNPHAPPIYPCGVCHKEVHDNDQAILCESGCNFWFHRGCTGLTEAAYQLLTAEVYAEWVCDKCLSSKSIPLVKFKP